MAKRRIDDSDRWLAIEVSNTGYPEMEKPTQSGRYEADFAKIAKAIHSATEGRSRQISYVVDPVKGTASSRYMIPKEFLKLVEEVVVKTSDDITSKTSYGGENSPSLYSQTSVSKLSTYHKSQEYATKQAKASIIAELKRKGVKDYKDTGKSIVADIPITDAKILSDKKAFADWNKSLFAEAKLINKKARGDASSDSEEETKEKEKAEEDKEAKDNVKGMLRHITKVVAVLSAIFLVVKRILNALTEAAFERQRDVLEGIALGISPSEMRNLRYFEKSKALPEGIVKDTAKSLSDSFGTVLNLSTNKEAYGKLMQAIAFASGGEEDASDLITSLAKGEITPKKATYDLLSILMKGWQERGANEGALGNIQRALSLAGFSDLGHILGAYASDVMKGNVAGGLAFEDYLATSKINVVEPLGMDATSAAFRDFAVAIAALKDKIKLDTMDSLKNVIAELNETLKSILNFFNRRTEKKNEMYENMSSLSDKEFIKNFADKYHYFKNDPNVRGEIIRRMREDPSFFDTLTKNTNYAGFAKEWKELVYEAYGKLGDSKDVVDYAQNMYKQIPSTLQDKYKNLYQKIYEKDKKGNLTTKDGAAILRQALGTYKISDEEAGAAFLYYLDAMPDFANPFTDLPMNLQTFQSWQSKVRAYHGKSNILGMALPISYSSELDASGTYSNAYHAMAGGESKITIQIQDKNGVQDVANFRAIMLDYNKSSRVEVINTGLGYETANITGDYRNA